MQDEERNQNLLPPEQGAGKLGASALETHQSTYHSNTNSPKAFTCESSIDRVTGLVLDLDLLRLKKGVSMGSLMDLDPGEETGRRIDTCDKPSGDR